ncbi:hypothetical protein METP1_01799 [Methanosarcinales archaeon]|nr:hypothetical protein METP1_01799 [Methanosarcinales archaeon]
MESKTIVILGIFILLLATSASGHPGNTDDNGGHYC